MLGVIDRIIALLEKISRHTVQLAVLGVEQLQGAKEFDDRAVLPLSHQRVGYIFLRLDHGFPRAECNCWDFKNDIQSCFRLSSVPAIAVG